MSYVTSIFIKGIIYMLAKNIFAQIPVYIKGGYGWEPETWASIGFSTRTRHNFIYKTVNGNEFIYINYITKNAYKKNPNVKQNELGKIVGFYIVDSSIQGDRKDFTDSKHYALEPQKWQNAFCAIEAYQFDKPIDVYEFNPDFKARSRSLAGIGEFLIPNDIEKLGGLSCQTVKLFKS